MNYQKRERHGGNRGVYSSKRGIKATTQFYRSGRATSLPKDWRNRLLDPASYYAQHVEKLSRPNATGWAQGRCPFHDDRNASLSVHVSDPRGGWRCFANCGGGDLVGFHMKTRGLPFREAARELIGSAR